MLPKNTFTPASSSGTGSVLKAAPLAALKPLKNVKHSFHPTTNANSSSSSASIIPSALDAPASSSKGTPSAAALPEGKDDTQVQELLALVRQRYPTSPSSAASSSSASILPSDDASSPSTTAAASVASAASSNSSFTDAASEARVDKLAILMSLFKARGMEPPPLPGVFDKKPIADLMQPPRLPMPSEFDLPLPTTPQSPQPPALQTKPSQTKPTPTTTIVEPKETSDEVAGKPERTRSDSPITTAEIAQLKTLFEHARQKIFKLTRLYQSGILKGAGATQATEKLSGLIRTYYQFIQQAKSHKHITEMDEEVQLDIACPSLQQLADRLYATARA